MEQDNHSLTHKGLLNLAHDLGGVCYFYLMLNITFFELNTE